MVSPMNSDAEMMYVVTGRNRRGEKDSGHHVFELVLGSSLGGGLGGM